MIKMDNLKTYKPTSPGQRFRVTVRRDELYAGKPEKNLTVSLKKHAGRNNTGRITCRHRGGGSKRKYRIISVDLPEGFYKVVNLQYDPNRTGYIALVTSEKTHKKYYVLAPVGLKSGDRFSHYVKDDYSLGSRMNLGKIPIGREIYNISNLQNGTPVYAKSAGSSARLVDINKGKNTVSIELPSKELVELSANCSANLGVVSNIDNKNKKIGKAGVKRHMGIRPTVRGVAMNPVDHPMGGGEGKSSGGRHPVTPWGQITKGNATAKYKKNRDHIIRSRKKVRNGG